MKASGSSPRTSSPSRPSRSRTLRRRCSPSHPTRSAPSRDTTTGTILIVSGPVGAGKSAVAHQLVRSSAGPTAYIEGDLYWRFIAKPHRDGDAGRAFRTVMRAMIASARHFKRDGYEAVLDFSIPPWYLDATRALLKGEPFDYVVICPSEAACASRAALRADGRIDDYAPYRDLYLSFDPGDRHAIADDEIDAEEIATLVRSSLPSGCFRVE